MLRTGIHERAFKHFRPIMLFFVILAGKLAFFSLLPIDYSAVGFSNLPEKEMLAEISKEFSATTTMLATLTSGMFVLLAVGGKSYLRADVRCGLGPLTLMIVFVVSAAGSLFVSVHVRYALARSLFGGLISIEEIEGILGIQAILVLACASAAVALILERILEFDHQ